MWIIADFIMKTAIFSFILIGTIFKSYIVFLMVKDKYFLYSFNELIIVFNIEEKKTPILIFKPAWTSCTFSAQRAVHSKLALHSPVTFNWIINEKKNSWNIRIKTSNDLLHVVAKVYLDYLFFFLSGFVKKRIFFCFQKKLKNFKRRFVVFCVATMSVLFASKFGYSSPGFCVSIITSFFPSKNLDFNWNVNAPGTRVKLSVWLIQFSTFKLRKEFPIRNLLREKTFFSQTNKRNVPIEIWSGF